MTATVRRAVGGRAAKLTAPDDERVLVGAFNAKGIKGTAYSLPMFARFKLTERVGLNFDLPLSYMDIAGAKVFGAGLSLGVPVKVVLKTKDSPWFWQLTPFAGGNVSASKDLLAGGLLANGGLNSVVSHDFGPFTLSLGNHFSIYEGVPLTLDSYKFDPGVSQQILKNGLKLDVPIGQRWIFDVYAVHTKFLSAAALDQYVTLGGEIGYRFGAKPNAARRPAATSSSVSTRTWVKTSPPPTRKLVRAGSSELPIPRDQPTLLQGPSAFIWVGDDVRSLASNHLLEIRDS